MATTLLRRACETVQALLFFHLLALLLDLRRAQIPQRLENPKSCFPPLPCDRRHFHSWSALPACSSQVCPRARTRPSHPVLFPLLDPPIGFHAPDSLGSQKWIDILYICLPTLPTLSTACR